jgi:creatinine amidohydrolase/Fe(II)-dependent formamide hydrolase-like protein
MRGRRTLRLHLFAMLCVALAWRAAVASAAEPVFLEELTSTELAARVRGGTTTVLVPIGGTEQNGAHMALGKHNARARALAARIATALGNALVAPVVAYAPEGRVTPPTEHMRFAGTISVPDAAFEQLLEGAARSLRAHGFRDIVFLGDHGGYRRDEQAVAERLTREWQPGGVRVHALSEYYRAASSGFAQALRARGYSQAEIGTHAGLADTALSMALTPELVRADRLATAGGVAGVAGDPHRATAKLGELGVNLIVDQSVAAIRRATRR